MTDPHGTLTLFGHDPRHGPDPGHDRIDRSPVAGHAITRLARPSHARAAQPSPLNFCNLGSGSGGNCSVLRLDDPDTFAGPAALLLDLGFGPMTLTRRLRRAGIEPAHLRAVLVTHLDHDHFRPACIPTLVRYRIPVHLHRWHAEELATTLGGRALADAGLVRPFDFAPFDLLHPDDRADAPHPARLRVTPVRLPHDQQGTTGFVVRWPHRQLAIGYATDLGHVPDELLLRLSELGGVDLLAIESNYDPVMQLRSSRPAVLKRRIMGRLGHLSNEESFHAVRRIAELSDPGRPTRVVLLHRSSQCNSPQKIVEMFGRDPLIAGRVSMTHQRRPTRWLTVRRPDGLEAARAAQLRLGW